jgi:hypothetical protein
VEAYSWNFVTSHQSGERYSCSGREAQPRPVSPQQVCARFLSNLYCTRVRTLGDGRRYLLAVAGRDGRCTRLSRGCAFSFVCLRLLAGFWTRRSRTSAVLAFPERVKVGGSIGLEEELVFCEVVGGVAVCSEGGEGCRLL